MADDACGEPGVWTNDVLVDKGRDVLFIPGDQDCGLEFRVFGIVQGFQSFKSAVVGLEIFRLVVGIEFLGFACIFRFLRFVATSFLVDVLE